MAMSPCCLCGGLSDRSAYKEYNSILPAQLSKTGSGRYITAPRTSVRELIKQKELLLGIFTIILNFNALVVRSLCAVFQGVSR